MSASSDTERACRAEGWILSYELLDAPYPHIVLAFIQLNEPAWREFEDNMDDSTALVFFNTNYCEFESVADWDALAAQRGIIVSQVTLTPPELGTALAALRLYQATTERLKAANKVLDIATNCGEFTALDDAAIDELCDKLNQTCKTK